MKESLVKYLPKTLGYILLSPAIYSVIAFFVKLLFNFNIIRLGSSYYWGGQTGEAGFTSPLPIYFGLTAIAGAYLVAKDSN